MKNESLNRMKAIRRIAKIKGWSIEQATQFWEVDSLKCDCGAAKIRMHKHCEPCAKVRREATRDRYVAAHKEQERRGDRIRHRIKNGMSREDAEALELTIGKCKCGADARTPRSRICEECYRANDRAAKRGKPLRTMDHLCATCGVAFKGVQNAKYCPIHKGGKKMKAQKPTLPNDWLKPAKRVPAPPPVERIINPGVEVTRIPSMFAGSRWTSPEEFNPETVRAVAEVMERIGR